MNEKCEDGIISLSEMSEIEKVYKFWIIFVNFHFNYKFFYMNNYLTVLYNRRVKYIRNYYYYLIEGFVRLTFRFTF